MSVLRKILGVLVMIAGILGLVLSIAGLIAVWTFKPAVTSGLVATVDTLNTSLTTSQQAMVVTGQALEGTINSVAALQTMLTATAKSVESTTPVMDQMTTFLGEKLPGTIGSAQQSLIAAQTGAEMLDSAIRSFDSFKSLLSGIPFIGGMIPSSPSTVYNPEKTLSESLGEVATQLDGLPEMFQQISSDLGKSGENMLTIQTSLDTMATNVGTITTSLEQYQSMIANSQSSMQNMQAMLSGIQANLGTILTGLAAVMTLFLLWLLAAQVVILSQGWELYQGTAGRMEGGSSTDAKEANMELVSPASAEDVVEPPAAQAIATPEKVEPPAPIEPAADSDQG